MQRRSIAAPRSASSTDGLGSIGARTKRARVFLSSRQLNAGERLTLDALARRHDLRRRVQHAAERSFSPFGQTNGAWLQSAAVGAPMATPTATRVCGVGRRALSPVRLLSPGTCGSGLRQPPAVHCNSGPRQGAAEGALSKAKVVGCQKVQSSRGWRLDQQHAFLFHKASYGFVPNDEQVVRHKLDVFVSVPAQSVSQRRGQAREACSVRTHRFQCRPCLPRHDKTRARQG